MFGFLKSGKSMWFDSTSPASEQKYEFFIAFC